MASTTCHLYIILGLGNKFFRMNDWLKTKKGLQYLLLKFPNDLVVNAIKEFRTNTSCPSYKF